MSRSTSRCAANRKQETTTTIRTSRKEVAMAEWSAPEYSRINSLQEWMADEQLKHVQLAGSERALDVGCGDGKVTAKIAARLPQGSIVGVDPSHSMVAYATEHYGPPHAANVAIRSGRRPAARLHGRVRPRCFVQRAALGARSTGRSLLDSRRPQTGRPGLVANGLERPPQVDRSGRRRNPRRTPLVELLRRFPRPVRAFHARRIPRRWRRNAVWS